MNVVLDVKNGSALKKPSKDNLILFDGKKWYVTTRQEVFEEYEQKVDKKLAEIEEVKTRLEQENSDFKKKVSKDIVEMSQIIRELYSK